MAVKKASTTSANVGNDSKSAANSSDLRQFLSEIERKAYEIYLARQSKNLPGDEMSDWLKAEFEIKAKYKIR